MFCAQTLLADICINRISGLVELRRGSLYPNQIFSNVDRLVNNTRGNIWQLEWQFFQKTVLTFNSYHNFHTYCNYQTSYKVQNYLTKKTSVRNSFRLSKTKWTRNKEIPLQKTICQLGSTYRPPRPSHSHHDRLMELSTHHLSTRSKTS